MPLRWRHNEHDCVSNHQRFDCLLNRLFMSRSKKTSKLRVTGLCVGNSPGPVNSPHKGPVTRKMFPFDDVIMYSEKICSWSTPCRVLFEFRMNFFYYMNSVQATNHDLNQWWPRLISHICVYRPQWVIFHQSTIYLVKYTHEFIYFFHKIHVTDLSVYFVDTRGTYGLVMWSNPWGPILLTWLNFNSSMDK